MGSTKGSRSTGCVYNLPMKTRNGHLEINFGLYTRSRRPVFYLTRGSQDFLQLLLE